MDFNGRIIVLVLSVKYCLTDTSNVNQFAVPSAANPLLIQSHVGSETFPVPSSKQLLSIQSGANPLPVSNFKPLPVLPEAEPIGIPERSHPLPVPSNLKPLPGSAEAKPLGIPEGLNPLPVNSKPLPVLSEHQPPGIPEGLNALPVPSNLKPLPEAAEAKPLGIPEGPKPPVNFEHKPPGIPEGPIPLPVPSNSKPPPVLADDKPLGIPDGHVPLPAPENINPLPVSTNECMQAGKLEDRANSSTQNAEISRCHKNDTRPVHNTTEMGDTIQKENITTTTIAMGAQKNSISTATTQNNTPTSAADGTKISTNSITTDNALSTNSNVKPDNQYDETTLVQIPKECSCQRISKVPQGQKDKISKHSQGRDMPSNVTSDNMILRFALQPRNIVHFAHQLDEFIETMIHIFGVLSRFNTSACVLGIDRSDNQFKVYVKVSSKYETQPGIHHSYSKKDYINSIMNNFDKLRKFHMEDAKILEEVPILVNLQDQSQATGSKKIVIGITVGLIQLLVFVGMITLAIVIYKSNSIEDIEKIPLIKDKKKSIQWFDRKKLEEHYADIF